jgi:predicted MFS family arabinose efflux permease
MTDEPANNSTVEDPPVGRASLLQLLRRRRMVALSTSFFFHRMATTINGIALPLLLIERFSIGPQLGLLLAVQALPSVLLSSAIGELVDRRGPRTVAIASSFIIAAFCLVFPLATSMWQIYLLIAMLGLSYSLGYPARMALRPLVAPAGQEVTANGLIVAVNRVAGLLGPVIAVLLSSAGLRWTFWVNALVITCAGLSLVGFPSTPLATRGASGVTRPPRRANAAALARWFPTANLRTLLRPLHSDRLLAALTLHVIFWMFASGLARIYLLGFAVRVLPGIPGAYGVIVTAAGIGGLLGSLTASYLSRLSPGVVYVASSAVGVLCWLSITMAHSLVLAVVLIAAATFGDSVCAVNFYAEVQKRVTSESTGRFFAMLMPLIDLSYMLGIICGGVIIQVGLSVLAISAAALMALPVLVFLRTLLSSATWVRAAQARGP